METAKKYTSFLRNYLLSSACYEFVFAYAVYTVFFSISGVSDFNISMLLMRRALTGVLFEIPSGALADYRSRRKLLIIAPLIKSLCFVTRFFADGDVFMYGLWFLFWSLGSSLRSGTTEAFLYDSLKKLDQTHNYEKVAGRKKFYQYVALAIAVLVGGFIANYHMDYAILLSLVPLCIWAVFASFLEESPKVESTEEVHYLQYIKIAFKEIHYNKLLRVFFVYMLGISVMWGLDEFDQLYFQFVNLPIRAFGIASTASFGLSAVSSYYIHKLKDKTYVYYLFPLLAWGVVSLVGFLPSIYMIPLLMISYAIMSPIDTLIDGKIQHSISSQSRATITSAASFLVGILCIAIYPVFGIISQGFNISKVYLSCGVLLLLVALRTLRYRKKFEGKEVKQI